MNDTLDFDGESVDMEQVVGEKTNLEMQLLADPTERRITYKQKAVG